MEIKNQSQVELTVNFFENFVKNVFDGDDENEKAYLFEKLKTLPEMYKTSRFSVKRKAKANPIDIVDWTEETSVQITPPKKLKVSPQSPQFPDEIWLRIIGIMKTKDVFGGFALTCKHFNSLSKDTRAIKFLYLKKIKSKEHFEMAMEVAKNSKNLIKFKIGKFYKKRTNVLAHFTLLRTFNPKLKTLMLGPYSIIREPKKPEGSLSKTYEPSSNSPPNLEISLEIINYSKNRRTLRSM